MKCVSCGKTVTLDDGYCEYQLPIAPDGGQLNLVYCLECDAAEDAGKSSWNERTPPADQWNANWPPFQF